MSNRPRAATLATLAAAAAAAALGTATVRAGALEATPDWAFPPLRPPRGAPGPAADADGARHVPGSRLSFTDAELHDMYRAVDWRPEGRAPPPKVVRAGRAPQLMACGYCHMPGGSGRPENAALAGLPADYIERQVADMRSGVRRSAEPSWGPAAYMHAVAAAARPEEVREAARYFAARPFRSRVRVVESATAPRAEAAAGVYTFARGGATERLGTRILEGPDDFERFELRDEEVDYTAYAPPGALGRGARLVQIPQGSRPACALCHGDRLQGGIGPPLAGRSPTALFRQLYGFQTGARRGSLSGPMRAVAAALTVSDMVDVAAYAASLR